MPKVNFEDFPNHNKFFNRKKLLVHDTSNFVVSMKEKPAYQYNYSSFQNRHLDMIAKLE